MAILRDVETSSRMMRRYYRIVKETMRAMAGYLPNMSLWSGKQLLARHIWLDAMHADMLRSRTLDLRYPRVDVDVDADAHLIRVLEKLPTAPSDEAFLSGVYGAVKPAVLEGLRSYLDGSDPLDDAPSHVYLRRIIDELEMELAEFRAAFPGAAAGAAAAGTHEDAARWQSDVAGALSACGGVHGPDRAPGEAFAGFLNRPPYEIPMEGGRDPSWEPAVMQVSPRPPRNFKEEQVRAAIDHANEVWASETPAALLWEYKQAPWDLQLSAARWCYDEMRHAVMGVQRLAEMGLEVGVDYPMVPDHWRAFRQRGIRYLLLLLHRLEQNGPRTKAGMRENFKEHQDFAAAQDCDFDWADESGHISFGLAWLRLAFPEWDKKRLMEEGDCIAEEWAEWMRAHHRNGTHGYEKFIERIDRKLYA